MSLIQTYFVHDLPTENHRLRPDQELGGQLYLQSRRVPVRTYFNDMGCRVINNNKNNNNILTEKIKSEIYAFEQIANVGG